MIISGKKKDGFFCKYNSLKFSLAREIDTQKKLTNFEIFLLLYDKIVQNTNFSKFPSFKWLFF